MPKKTPQPALSTQINNTQSAYAQDNNPQVSIYSQSQPAQTQNNGQPANWGYSYQSNPGWYAPREDYFHLEQVAQRCVCVGACEHACVRASACVCVRACARALMRAHACVYVCVCVCARMGACAFWICGCAVHGTEHVSHITVKSTFMATCL